MRRERGFTLLWAMLLVVLVGSMTSVVLTRDQTVRRETRTDLRALGAFHAAEGGVEKARHALATDPAWTGAIVPLGTHTVTVRVTRPTPSTWKVKSQAEPGAGRVTVELVAGEGLPAVRAWQRSR